MVRGGNDSQVLNPFTFGFNAEGRITGISLVSMAGD